MSTCVNLLAGTVQGQCFQNEIDATRNNIDTFWLIFAGSLVFFMQAGFAMLCAGCVRTINIKNIMLKNLLDACGGAIGYWILGYGFAYGSNDNAFIGDYNFLLVNADGMTGYDLSFFFFQWAFAATAATIVAGTVAERCRMIAYFIYSFALTAFVYPIVTRAFWDVHGWGSAFRSTGPRMFDVGMIDFAGSGVVHLTGGTTALVAAIILGPRIGRFKDEHGVKLLHPKDMGSHSVILQVLGTFILWFGWYGFNPGSTLIHSTPDASYTAAICAVNTTLSAASGAISAFGLRWFLSEEGLLDITALSNGALSGLVAITAGCSVVWPWAAVVIGFTGGFIYIGASNLLIKLGIDDAVDAIPVHFANGIWGCIAVGLFATGTLINKAYDAPTTLYQGWFYEWGNGSGDGRLLAAQLCGVLFIIGWTVCLMFPLFWTLNQFGLFRVSREEEQVGLDISHHGGAGVHLTKPTAEAIENHRRSSLDKSRSTHGQSPAPVTATKVIEIEEGGA
ncbi:hypothetical protein TrVE_jg10393 [Triparma verrucosa]|uniref:Ammonium transporter n=1 Tax=Triparma verrucosa TaxID=1606542 RepID=A0A9W7KRZ0_9STRA|nr:hypothetical protein TrVE_jg10393 [Triparma verrucosa]